MTHFSTGGTRPVCQLPPPPPKSATGYSSDRGYNWEDKNLQIYRTFIKMSQKVQPAKSTDCTPILI